MRCIETQEFADKVGTPREIKSNMRCIETSTIMGTVKQATDKE